MLLPINYKTSEKGSHMGTIIICIYLQMPVIKGLMNLCALSFLQNVMFEYKTKTFMSNPEGVTANSHDILGKS